MVKIPNLIEWAILQGELPPAEREYRFARPRRWASDYAWPEAKLLVEIEGGLYGRGKPCPMCRRRGVGAHSSIQRLKSDLEKYNAAAILGYRLLRFMPEQVTSGEAVAIIKEFLAR